MSSISITLKIFSCKVFTESKFAFYSVVLHFVYRTQLKEWTVKSAADILNDNKQAKTSKTRQTLYQKCCQKISLSLSSNSNDRRIWFSIHIYRAFQKKCKYSIYGTKFIMAYIFALMNNIKSFREYMVYKFHPITQCFECMGGVMQQKNVRSIFRELGRNLDLVE